MRRYQLFIAVAVFLPAAPLMGITLNVGSTFQVGQSPVYEITGAPPSCPITWDSWYRAPDGAGALQIVNGYPNGTTDASGRASIGGNPWTAANVGFWTARVNVCGESALSDFTVEAGSAGDSFAPEKISQPTSRRDLLGVTGWGGLYRLNSQPTQLEEEAQAIEGMGADTIYLVLGYNYQEAYLSSNFGGPVVNLTDLARSAPYSSVFHQPFKTYLLATYAFGNRRYLDAPDLNAEYAEINALATYLLLTYAGTGKTFVLKNWEGDNALAQQSRCGKDACVTTEDYRNFTPDAAMLRTMVDWLNTRQRAIVDARAAAGASGVQVLQAVEFNLLSRARQMQPCVLRDVVPNAHTDLISYSAYESINVLTQNLRSQIDDDIDFIRRTPGLNDRQLIIGEFGWPNDTPSIPDVALRTDIASQAFLNNGVARAAYWALYDNGSGQSLIDRRGAVTQAGSAMKTMVRKSPMLN